MWLDHVDGYLITAQNVHDLSISDGIQAKLSEMCGRFILYIQAAAIDPIRQTELWVLGVRCYCNDRLFALREQGSSNCLQASVYI